MAITVTATQNANVCVLNLAAMPAQPGLPLNLDCSLQRHSYLFLDGANAKPMNSILHYVVQPADVLNDLRSIGQLLAAKLTQIAALTPLQLQVEAAAAMRSRAATATVSIAQANRDPLGTVIGHRLFGDYSATSGRVYRVDNVAMDPARPPNHCYPIAGPFCWAGVTQPVFAAAAGLRRLQVEMQRYPGNETPGWLAKKWASLQYGGRDTDIFRAISGPRVALAGLTTAEQAELAAASGVGWLIAQAIALRND